MPSLSMTDLPREILYSIFGYLKKEHVAYAFFGLNDNFTSAAKYFIGQEFTLTSVEDERLFAFCLTTVLPSIGFKLRYLSIGHPHALPAYAQTIRQSCANLDLLNIHCHTQAEDIRCYAARLIHAQLSSLIILYNNRLVGEETSARLLDRCDDAADQTIPLASTLVLNIPSLNDLAVLKRYSESSYLADGSYMIECLATGQWLTDGKDDLCVMIQRLHRDSIFSIKQIDADRRPLEYELYNEGTQRRLTVLIPYEEEEERWPSASILSTHRKESSRSCSSFTFERAGNDDRLFIRPCYSQAKRLQIAGKRVIIARCDNENVTNHCFKLHRVS